MDAAFIRGKKFLCFDGEAKGLCLVHGELLKLGLHVLVDGWIALVLCKPLDFIANLCGAFAENEAARATRLKVEKLGLKTYVQVAETTAGKRIRVRVGPFTSKEEAELAKTKLTAGGFAAVLLVL